MKKTNNLISLVQSFFQKYLTAQHGLSQNTFITYRDAIKLFFKFESFRQQKSTIKLVIEDLNSEAILEFLNQIKKQETRNKKQETRNKKQETIL